MALEPSLKYRSSRQEVPRAMQLSDHMKTSGWSGGRRQREGIVLGQSCHWSFQGKGQKGQG